MLQVVRLHNHRLPMAQCTIKVPRRGMVDHHEHVGGDHGHMLPPSGHAAVTMEAFADVITLQAKYAPQHGAGAHPDGMCVAY